MAQPIRSSVRRREDRREPTWSQPTADEPCLTPPAVSEVPDDKVPVLDVWQVRLAQPLVCVAATRSQPEQAIRHVGHTGTSRVDVYAVPDALPAPPGQDRIGPRHHNAGSIAQDLPQQIVSRRRSRLSRKVRLHLADTMQQLDHGVEITAHRDRQAFRQQPGEPGVPLCLDRGGATVSVQARSELGHPRRHHCASPFGCVRPTRSRRPDHDLMEVLAGPRRAAC
jgi:hypothetical protein